MRFMQGRLGYFKEQSRRFGTSFSFIGLVVAALFFSASVTPSLLPRHYVTQGLLGGFSLAIGYGVGVVLLLLYQFLELPKPGGTYRRVSQAVIVGVVALIIVISLWRMSAWQNSIRVLMEMPPLETAYPISTAAIAIPLAVVLVLLGRGLRHCENFVTGKLRRFIPRRIARAIGVAVVALFVLFLSNDVIAVRLLRAADQFFSRIDQAATDDIEQPIASRVTGSVESLVTWESIGHQGKCFLTAGPTQKQISDFFGGDAQRPLRVYVGMRSRPTMRERAELALAELQRVGGFERSKLIVATPTGTGWLDPSAVDTVEYLHRGDTAIVSMQYSYLPSWITILVDPRSSIESAEALFEVIYGYWKTLPHDARPDLYLQGLSLGSLGSEQSADLFTIFEDPIQGSVWSGPPFPSHNWRRIVRQRNDGTPEWMPEFRDGRMLRFTSQTNHLDDKKPWGPIRSVYIQQASDPMVWFSPDLAWSRPDWLDGARGPDVSPALRWYPIVTFLQIGFDLPVATAVPLGYGHNYAPSSYIDAWIAVTDPKSWNNELTQRLKATFRHRETPKP